MSVSIVKYAFVGGEISPQLFGRTDLEKYDLGLAELYNWFVDYRGGITTRAGLGFVDYTNYNDEITKFIPFRFAPNLVNTYVIMFHDHKVSFYQDGAPIVTTVSGTISGITRAGIGVVTLTSHGLAEGDRIVISGVVGMTEVNDRTFTVGAVTANTFALRYPGPDARQFNTSTFAAYTSGGVVQKIYTIESPYSADELADLRYYQIRDTIRLTHPNYRVRNLVRNDHTDWEIVVEEFGSDSERPGGLAATASDVGNASVGFVVTAVDADNVESLPSDTLIANDIINYTTTAGSVTLVWDAVPGAKYYNVYRTVVLPGPDSGAATDPVVTRAEQVGFIGQSFAPRFVDSNIIPDFVRAPPQFANPFALSAIESIEVTDGGTGYPADATVTVAGGDGAGFEGFPIVDPSGVIVSVVISNGGNGYDEPVTVTFAGSGGADAEGEATLTPATGAFPTISTVFQQRNLYAASLNDPLTIWGSQPGRFSVFDVSQILADNDAFELEIDSQEVSPLLHLIATRSGLLVMSQAGVWLLHGDSNSGAVTPTNALADPQNYRGTSAVPPIPIDSDLLYVEGKGTTVRLLSYSEVSKQYLGQNISVLAAHLFTSVNKISSWVYASNPHNVIWSVRSDGAFLPLTLVKDQDVYAWGRCMTEGLVTDSCVVEEDGIDRVYFAVRRYIEGRWIKYVERMEVREINFVEEAKCLDSALSTELVYPDARVQAEAASGTDVALISDDLIFTEDDVGKVVRLLGGKGTVTTFLSEYRVLVDFDADRPITEVLPESGMPVEARSGEWTMDTPFTTISGLWHLEGQTVYCLADGNVMGPLTVSEGSITLEGEATIAVVGLKYTCRALTLPPAARQATLENKRKRPVEIASRIHETRGLKVGAALDALEEMRERESEVYGAPINLQDGTKYSLIEAPFNDAGQTYFVQDNPLPATLIGIVLDMEVGDDSR